MITYPKKEEKFTIDDFRSDGSVHMAEYYIHVVNDDTEVCKRLFSSWNFALVMRKYEEYKMECADGWHIEITVAISTSEARARLM